MDIKFPFFLFGNKKESIYFCNQASRPAKNKARGQETMRMFLPSIPKVFCLHAEPKNTARNYFKEI